MSNKWWQLLVIPWSLFLPFSFKVAGTLRQQKLEKLVQRVLLCSLPCETQRWMWGFIDLEFFIKSNHYSFAYQHTLIVDPLLPHKRSYIPAKLYIHFVVTKNLCSQNWKAPTYILSPPLTCASSCQNWWGAQEVLDLITKPEAMKNSHVGRLLRKWIAEMWNLGSGIFFSAMNANLGILKVSRVCNSIMNTHIIYLQTCNWIKPKDSQPMHYLLILIWKSQRECGNLRIFIFL